MADSRDQVSTFKAIVGAFSIVGVVFSIAWTVYTHRSQDNGRSGARTVSLIQRLRKQKMELKKAEEQARRLEVELASFRSKSDCELATDKDPQTLSLGKRGRFQNVSTSPQAIQIVSVTEGRVAWRKPGDKARELKAASGQAHRGVLEPGSCTTLEGPIALAALPVSGDKAPAKVIVWTLR